VASFECKQGDHGVCSIPPSTLVVSGGELSAATREEVAARFPDLVLEEAPVRKLDFTGSHEDLREAVDVSLAQEGLALATPLTEAVAETGVSNGVIVICTCGHMYVVEQDG
jgi:hypothetical protein